jgi:hypothetical protein
MRRSRKISTFLQETVEALGGPEVATVTEVVWIATEKRPDLKIDREMVSKFISEAREREKREARK